VIQGTSMNWSVPDILDTDLGCQLDQLTDVSIS
jgi:hypothetical protein